MSCFQVKRCGGIDFEDEDEDDDKDEEGGILELVALPLHSPQ